VFCERKEPDGNFFLNFSMEDSLVVLILCNGLAGTVVQEMLGDMKTMSKNVGTHKKRELYWQAYSKLASLGGSFGESKVYGFLTYRLAEGDDDAENGKAAFIECTKRQRGLLTSVEILGKKFKQEDAESKNEWFACYVDGAAQEAMEDITNGEPVVYLSQDQDAVFVGTKLKRKKCRSAPTQPLKSMADFEAFKETLLPENPLVSISWTGNDPVKLNGYNFILAGKFAKSITDDPSVSHIATTSVDEIYEYFLKQRNEHFVIEAEKLIAVMLAEVNKNEPNPICNVTVKLAGVARQNGLLKKVYVDSSKKKFIEAVLADGSGVEMFIIQNAPETSQFMTFGGIVFELHYRADLNMFI